MLKTIAEVSPALHKASKRRVGEASQFREPDTSPHRRETLANVIDGEQYELMLREAQQELVIFVTAEGTVAFPAPAHCVTASKPAVAQ